MFPFTEILYLNSLNPSGTICSSFQNVNLLIVLDCLHAQKKSKLMKMLTMAQSLVTRLRENGVNDLVIEEIFHPTQQLSRLHVRFSRILLPDYQNMEIKMSPLPKAVFLLYLKHPEGIRFCDLPEYREELYHIYASFSGRDDANDIRASIDDVTNPLSNSINEKCSRIRHAFLSKFEEKLARNYYITGDRGTAKKIILPRELVTWEE